MTTITRAAVTMIVAIFSSTAEAQAPFRQQQIGPLYYPQSGMKIQAIDIIPTRPDMSITQNDKWVAVWIEGTANRYVKYFSGDRSSQSASTTILPGGRWVRANSADRYSFHYVWMGSAGAASDQSAVEYGNVQTAAPPPPGTDCYIYTNYVAIQTGADPEPANGTVSLWSYNVDTCVGTSTNLQGLGVPGTRPAVTFAHEIGKGLVVWADAASAKLRGRFFDPAGNWAGSAFDIYSEAGHQPGPPTDWISIDVVYIAAVDQFIVGYTILRDDQVAGGYQSVYNITLSQNGAPINSAVHFGEYNWHNVWAHVNRSAVTADAGGRYVWSHHSMDSTRLADIHGWYGQDYGTPVIVGNLNTPAVSWLIDGVPGHRFLALSSAAGDYRQFNVDALNVETAAWERMYSCTFSQYTQVVESAVRDVGSYWVAIGWSPSGGTQLAWFALWEEPS